jgi:arginyl-tRNA synthetase
VRDRIEAIVLAAVSAAVDNGELALAYTPEAAIERPRDATHGDWACTLPLRLSKELKKAPRDIAALIVEHIGDDPSIESIQIAGPGFINLKLSTAALQSVIKDAGEQGAGFAQLSDGAGKTVNLEFISANPTGPMHVGHGRWAALGNAMANILEHAGWQVTREFYINDAGSQMEKFGHSIALRYLELYGEKIEMPEDSYGGAYIIEVAAQLKERVGNQWVGTAVDAAARDDYFKEAGYAIMLEAMQSLLEGIGVPFHVWFSERKLYEKGSNGEPSPLEAALDKLAQADRLYEADGATWFRTTDLGDDKDRVLIKADGTYTYFAPDIAYHLNKFERSSEYLINIWGADHHGYVPRMQAACTALGYEGKLTVVLGQLVNLFRAGQAVRMSKRTGERVTFEELIDEVGADATKYLMLSRSADQTIDFDIEVAKKQDSTNPVYYVQYAHARICSILRKAASEQGIGEQDYLAADLSLLSEPEELDLARAFERLSDVVSIAARELAPNKLTHYAEDLASVFHSFYTQHKVINDDRQLTLARLYLASATKSVLGLVLGLLGVSAPERM